MEKCWLEDPGINGIYSKNLKEKAGCQEKILDTPALFVYDNQGDCNGENSGADIIV